MEANTKMKVNTSCTLLPCYKLAPPKQSVPYPPIAHIDFNTLARKRPDVHDCKKEIIIQTELYPQMKNLTAFI